MLSRRAGEGILSRSRSKRTGGKSETKCDYISMAVALVGQAGNGRTRAGGCRRGRRRAARKTPRGGALWRPREDLRERKKRQHRRRRRRGRRSRGSKEREERERERKRERKAERRATEEKEEPRGGIHPSASHSLPVTCSRRHSQKSLRPSVRPRRRQKHCEFLFSPKPASY